MTPYFCPCCKGNLQLATNDAVCDSCGKKFPTPYGIPDLRGRDGYWCNVPRERMVEVIDRGRSSRDWRATVQDMLPDYARAIIPYSRADGQFVMAIDSTSRVLDAGSMWGALTLPVAQYCGEIHAADQTVETLALLKTRAEQDGLDNVHPVACGLDSLPFPDAYFDAVILNGVLEWVAFESTMVVEDQLLARGKDAKASYTTPPDTKQVAVLRELARVVKPGGSLYIAIENRYGLQYFLGFPDEHVNLRFTSILPRGLADRITRRRRGFPYRTWTYSPNSLANILKRGGFSDPVQYAAFPTYRLPTRIVPLAGLQTFGRWAFNVRSPIKHFILGGLLRCLPSPLMRATAPNLLAVAGKTGPARPPRICRLLTEAGVASIHEAQTLLPTLLKWKTDDDQAVLAAVHRPGHKEPSWFCKVGRTPAVSKAFAREAAHLDEAGRMLEGSPLAGSIPEIAYTGVCDSVPLMVYKAARGKTVSPGLWSRLSAESLNKLHLGFLTRPKAVSRLRAKMIRRDMDRLSPFMDRAAKLLGRFQRTTRQEEVDAGEHLIHWLRETREDLPLAAAPHLERLEGRLTALKGVPLPLCAVHGDFYLTNLVFRPEGVTLLDFEHFQPKGLPFLDPGALCFNLALLLWRKSLRPVSLPAFLDESGMRPHLRQWLEAYAAEAGLDHRILDILPQLATVQQNAMKYEGDRDPATMPLYGEESLRAVLELLSSGEENVA